MWRIVTVLGLLLCCTGSAAAAGAAEYRFQALVDRDQSAKTGCDFETPPARCTEKNCVFTRKPIAPRSARGGRTMRIGRVARSQLGRERKPLGLGQGRLGSDAIEFDIQRNWLADAQAIDLQLFGQNIASGAFDFVGDGDGSGQLLISLGGSVSDVPLFGQLAAVLFACGVVLIARRHQVALRSRMILSLLALLGLGSFAIGPIRDSHAGLLGTPVEIAVRPTTASARMPAWISLAHRYEKTAQPSWCGWT